MSGNNGTVQFCKNCHAPVIGKKYCSSCGQRSDTHVLALAELVEDFFDGLLDVDSRLWRSLVPLIIRPGRLTIEYLSGRRMYYLPPFRLYLILSVLFFLIPGTRMNFDDNDFDTGNRGEEIRQQIRQEQDGAPGRTGEESAPGSEGQCEMKLLPQESFVTIQMRQACLNVWDNPRPYFQAFADNIPIMMILGIPLVALVMQGLYFFSHRKYVEHIVFLCHTHAFFFLLSLLVAFASLVGTYYPFLEGTMNTLRTVCLVYFPVYVFVALMKVYGDSLIKTAVKSFFLLTGYALCVGIVMTVGLIFTVFSV